MIYFKAAHHRATLIPWVSLKTVFAPLPLGGAGGGAQLRQREKQIICVRGLSVRAGSFFVLNA
jgi:hypothetical protein